MGLVNVLVLVQLGCFVVMAFGVLGQKFQFLPFKLAFGGFALAALASFIVFVVGLVLTLMSLGKVQDEHRWLTLGVTAAAFVPLLFIGVLVGKGIKKPRIHDISTDPDKPLQFTNAFDLRRPLENSLLAPEDKTVELQKLHYPDLKPLLVEMSPAAAFANAISTAQELGWKITVQDSATGTFEAIDETAIFGFRDDIVVRVGPFNSGTRIDLRSVSRVGIGDLGANAARIEKFQTAFKGNM